MSTQVVVPIAAHVPGPVVDSAPTPDDNMKLVSHPSSPVEAEANGINGDISRGEEPEVAKIRETGSPEPDEQEQQAPAPAQEADVPFAELALQDQRGTPNGDAPNDKAEQTNGDVPGNVRLPDDAALPKPEREEETADKPATPKRQGTVSSIVEKFRPKGPASRRSAGSRGTRHGGHGGGHGGGGGCVIF